MDRRNFIKAASAAGCLAPFSGISNLACATQAPSHPLLITVFLRGGADGLNLVAPTSDPNYVAARPPELRVLESGEYAGSLIEHTLDPTAGFRLHHSAGPLSSLYQAGRLAIVHAVGLTDGTRSHFVAQDLIERGINDEKHMTRIDSGWLARSLADVNGLVSGYSATPATAFAMHGLASALSTPDISTALGIPWGKATSDLLRALNIEGTTPVHRAGLKALQLLESVERNIPRDAAGKIVPYVPSGARSHEGSGDFSRTLSSVARLAKMDVGLSAACVDHGGWDTHEGQQGRFANQVRQLSLGLAAFHDDMAAAGRKIIVVVMTEFGRRLRANKSGGTDHGHGGCWLVLGDTVVGGRMYGRWPGLTTQALDQGVDLAVTTDYRAVLSEVLRASGLSTKGTFPDWRPVTSLGLFESL
ncbi:MAG: DUF1501 domain-containing protein [Betaproteobacteria bacterium]